MGKQTSSGGKAKLRICLDPRPLNLAIQREHFKIPKLDDIATRLSGATVFSKLDANHGYWQEPLYSQHQSTTYNIQQSIWTLLLYENAFWHQISTRSVHQPDVW